MRQDEPKVWGVHTGRPRGQSKSSHRQLEQETDRLFKLGYVALGWPQMGNLGTLEAETKAFKDRYRTVYGQEVPSRTMGADTGMLFQFVHGIQTGDIVAWRSHVDGQLHLGQVTGPYRHDPSMNGEYHHLRPIEWLTAIPTHNLTSEARNQLRQPRSLFQIRKSADEYRQIVAKYVSTEA